MKFIDLTGQRFGRLTVVSINKKSKHTTWNCVCDCGKEKVVIGCHLRSGRIVSCGCASTERISVLNKTHGEAKTRLYGIWTGIKVRCYNRSCKSYHNYGGRSISMCDEWKNRYETFREWAYANGYDENLTIDRIDDNGNYEPSNCRWVTPKQQSNNTRRTIFVEYENEKYSIKQLAELLNLNYLKLLRGIGERNMSIPEAIAYAKTHKKRIKKE